jgi:hypothetical protein
VDKVPWGLFCIIIVNYFPELLLFPFLEIFVSLIFRFTAYLTFGSKKIEYRGINYG